jgi:hypothetical protein
MEISPTVLALSDDTAYEFLKFFLETRENCQGSCTGHNMRVSFLYTTSAARIFHFHKYLAI